MKIIKAHYYNTFPDTKTGQWIKIGLEAELIEGDDVRQSLYALKKQVSDFYFESKGHDEKLAAESKEVVLKADLENEQALEAVKKQLDTFKFKEDAELYLSATDFKYNIEAKNIVNQKPSKK